MTRLKKNLLGKSLKNIQGNEGLNYSTKTIRTSSFENTIMGTAQQIYVDFDSFYGILCNKDIPATIYWYNETASTKNKIGFF